MTNARIGVFGSAFDPPTLGHLDVLKQVAHRFDRILLVPSASHAFQKKSQPFSVRLSMLHEFVSMASVGVPLEVCDIEQTLLQLHPGQPVYTFTVLEALEQKYEGGTQLSFIRGPDNAAPEVWARFYKSAEIEKRWSIVTAEERLIVRSSLVRSLLFQPTTDAGANLDDFLLPSVASYIQKHKLYQENA